MRVLITGGAGFIGAHVGKALQERGVDVVLLDDFNDFYDPRLKHARIAALLKPETPVVTGDVAEPGFFASTVADTKPEAVLHFAAWAGVGPSRAHPLRYADANVTGAVAAFDACVRHGVGRVVFASSSSVYGAGTPIPTPEEAMGEDLVSGYGVSKRAGELYASLYHRLEGLRVTCLRFHTVYGPWGRPDMAVWKFTARLRAGMPLPLNVLSHDGREVRRDFTEVSDIVRGVLSALDRDHPFAIVNLGSAQPVPLRRLVAALERELRVPAKIEEHVLPSDEATETGADLTRAGQLLGFQPSVRLEAGVERFAAWYRDEFEAAFPDGLRPSQFWDA